MFKRIGTELDLLYKWVRHPLREVPGIIPDVVIAEVIAAVIISIYNGITVHLVAIPILLFLSLFVIALTTQAMVVLYFGIDSYKRFREQELNKKKQL